MRDFNTYQEWTRTTWMASPFGPQGDYLHAIHGFTAEVGEMHGIFQRYNRGDFAELAQSPEGPKQLDDMLVRELGDILYYLVRIIDEHGLVFQDVVDANVNKLEVRKATKQIMGKGDNREKLH